MVACDLSANCPARAVRRQTFDPAGALAGTEEATVSEPSLPTPLFSDDRAWLKVPSIVPQTERRSGSGESDPGHAERRGVLEATRTQEPPARAPGAGGEARCAGPREAGGSV